MNRPTPSAGAPAEPFGMTIGGQPPAPVRPRNGSFLRQQRLIDSADELRRTRKIKDTGGAVLSIIACLIGAFLLVKFHRSYVVADAAYERVVAEGKRLERERDEARARRDREEAYLKLLRTDNETIRRLLREKLGLKMRNEIIFEVPAPN
ncbi:MAG: septum formation initiator family protein [Puniceicoccales bacterium]|nr:septum formation initiator family protein [Puniceicoccales bacterium]